MGHTLARILIDLLDHYNLKKNKLYMWKMRGQTLNVMITSLKFIVNGEVLNLKESFQGTCLGLFL
jgi:hypothetical protein